MKLHIAGSQDPASIVFAAIALAVLVALPSAQTKPLPRVYVHTEQSTGDGVLTGLIVSDLVARRGAALSTLAAAMTRLPQVLVNVRLDHKVDLAAEPAILAAVHTIEAELGDRGRVLVRSSGTEPLLRVMVEAPTPAEAEAAAARIVSAMETLEK